MTTERGQVVEFWASQVAQDRLRAILGGDAVQDDTINLRTACSRILASYSKPNLNQQEENQLRHRLRSLMNLIRHWSREMENKYGRGFWQRLTSVLQDGRTLAWIKLLQEVSTGHSQDALDSLVDLGRTGLKWRIGSGREKAEIYSDFGLEFFWVITRRIADKLDQDFVPAISAAAPSPRMRSSKLFLSLNNDGQLELQLTGRRDRSPRTIGRPQIKDLLIHISSSSYTGLRSNWDESIWNFIVNGQGRRGERRGEWLRYTVSRKKDGRSDGVNHCLRKLIQETNDLLDDLLGQTPLSSERWLVRVPGNYTKKQSRYQWTKAITPFLGSDDYLKYCEQVWSPGDIDRYSRRSGRRRTKPPEMDED